MRIHQLWAVADIANAQGVIVFPPRQVGMAAYGTGLCPVYTGVTMMPGDSDADVIIRAKEQFPVFLMHYAPSQLRVHLRDGAAEGPERRSPTRS